MPIVMVHTPEQIRAALTAAVEAGRPVVLASSPGAATWQGPRWLAAVAAAAAPPGARYHVRLHCGASPGHALAALEAGIPEVAVCPALPALPRLRAIAESLGAVVLEEPPCTLDLAGMDHAAARSACRALLASPPKAMQGEETPVPSSSR